MGQKQGQIMTYEQPNIKFYGIRKKERKKERKAYE